MQPDYQDTGFPMRTLVEVQLDKLTHSIRTKLQWCQNVHDSDVQKLRAEAVEPGIPEVLSELGIKVCYKEKLTFLQKNFGKQWT